MVEGRMENDHFMATYPLYEIRAGILTLANWIYTGKKPFDPFIPYEKYNIRYPDNLVVKDVVSEYEEQLRQEKIERRKNECRGN